MGDPKVAMGPRVLTVPRAITPLSPHRVSCPPGPPANTIVPSGSHPNATTAPGTALLGGVGDIAMGSPVGGRDPKWARIEAKRPQNGPQMDTKWPQMDPKWTQNGHKWTQNGPKMDSNGPKLTQNGHKWTQMDPKWTQNGPKWTQNGHKWTQNGPKWIQNGHKWTQNGHKLTQNGAKMVPN